jgi:hypothetical protein
VLAGGAGASSSPFRYWMNRARLAAVVNAWMWPAPGTSQRVLGGRAASYSAIAWSDGTTRSSSPCTISTGIGASSPIASIGR